MPIEKVAWYRKYRPKNIDDYMGDDIKHIVKARFTVAENRPSVLMLHGTRGCGKTTFARIITKYYLCENTVNGEPCEQCEICQTINEELIDGEIGIDIPGVIEVDATTANGKDAIQGIIDDVILPPVYTKYKILILDECHMITPQAQNSMLKVIEDIPNHLIVIFATTDPEKVIGTIHSRCQVKIEVKKKTVKELVDRLLMIAEQEGLTTSKEALRIIAKKSDRVPRESINLLEDIAKSYGNKVTVENVRVRTGHVSSEIYMAYFEASTKGLEDILQFNKKLRELDITGVQFISGLTRFALDCIYIKYGIGLEEYTPEHIKQVKKVFKLYKSNEFDTLLQIIEHASKLIGGSDDNKNELIITNTAIRIGKIDILTNGLGNEVEQAVKENKRSIEEYHNTVKLEISQQLDKVEKIEPKEENLVNVLKGLKDVSNAEGLVITKQKTDDDKNKKESDGIMSIKEIENMLGIP